MDCTDLKSGIFNGKGYYIDYEFIMFEMCYNNMNKEFYSYKIALMDTDMKTVLISNFQLSVSLMIHCTVLKSIEKPVCCSYKRPKRMTMMGPCYLHL